MIEYENLGKVNQKLFDKYQDKFDEILKSGWYILALDEQMLNETHDGSTAGKIQASWVCSYSRYSNVLAFLALWIANVLVWAHAFPMES